MTSSLLLSVAFQTSTGLPLFLIGILFLVAFAIWSYRWTRPPVSPLLRKFLVILRCAALLLAWLFVTAFEMNWEKEETVKPDIAVLIDQSSSMNFTDGELTRMQVLQSIYDNPTWEELEKRYDLDYFAFDGDIRQVSHPETGVAPRGNVTDLHRAISSLGTIAKGLPDAVILLTDGATNTGGSPEEAAREIQRPVFPVAIGDSLPPKDIVIREINAPASTYSGDTTSVDLTVRATGVAGSRAQLVLTDDAGNRIYSDSLSFTSQLEDQLVTLQIVPKEPGVQNWIVSVEPLEGEISMKNNRRRFIIDIMERRRRILLVAGIPSYEASFLAETLESDEDTDPVILIGGGPGNTLVRGNVPSGGEISELNAAVLLLDSAVDQMLRSLIQRLVSSKIPLVIITGGNPDQRALRNLESVCGEFRFLRSKGDRSLIPIEYHPIFTSDRTWFENNESVVPPLEIPDVTLDKGRVLAITNYEQRNRPGLVIANTSPRTLVFLAGSLWRWDQLRRPVDPMGEGYQSLWERLLRWITADSEKERIKVYPSKKLFQGGEQVKLVAEVLDESLQPVADASIHATVLREEKEHLAEFRKRAPGRYEAAIDPWTSGLYHFSATIEYGDATFSRSGTFAVDDFSLEETELRMRPDRLRSIAKASGGTLLFPDQVDRLTTLLPSDNETVIVRKSWKPSRIRNLFFLIVFILAIEWLIRTRKGMI